ncbi:MAG: hypothetical protein JWM95_2753 [Gemmatimonadetes bacterium]|nr:hypothetical protein [Gemmatimonadota bacterium]
MPHLIDDPRWRHAEFANNTEVGEPLVFADGTEGEGRRPTKFASDLVRRSEFSERPSRSTESRSRLQNGQCELSDSRCQFNGGRARKADSRSRFSESASEFFESGFWLHEGRIRFSYCRFALCEDRIRFHEGGASTDTLAQSCMTLAAHCARRELPFKTTTSRSQIARSGMLIVTSSSTIVTPRCATVTSR